MQGKADGSALWQQALQFRDELDLVNAVELLEARGEDLRARHAEAQDRAIAAGIPAFFSSFMMKSGGTYLHSSLVRSGAVDFFHHTQSPIDFQQAYLISTWLKSFLLGGASCHTHFLPTPHNLRVMRHCGVRQIWLHLRDPRQVALSMFWHLRGLGQGEGAVAAQRQSEIAAINSRARSIGQARGRAVLMDLDFESQILDAFEIAHTWAVQWAAAAAREDLSCLFTTFEQMTSALPALEDSVRAFFAVPDRLPALFAERIAADRFRRGQSGEWRDVYSPALKATLLARFDKDLMSRFGWSAS